MGSKSLGSCAPDRRVSKKNNSASNGVPRRGLRQKRMKPAHFSANSGHRPKGESDRMTDVPTATTFTQDELGKMLEGVRPRALRLTKDRGVNPRDRADVVSDCLLAALKAVREGRFDPGRGVRFSTWCHGVFTHTISDYLRLVAG